MDVRLVLTGFGNVGQGVASLLRQRGAQYERRYGVRLVLTGVADRRGAVTSPAGLDPAALLSSKRATGTVATLEGASHGLQGDRFLEGAGGDVLLETASTNFQDAEPGWSYARAAIARGMHVVLASKGALALHYRELLQSAERSGVDVAFSATVGAPLPVLEIANRALVSTEIVGFEGIVNGTTNHILTAMAEGASYDEGVRQAQAMGIAETDPTLDVDGWDAAAKVVILANTIFGTDLTLNDVDRQGIRGVTAEELQEAAAQGETIKLIAQARREGHGVVARVAPQRRALTDALGRLRYDEMGIVLAAEQLGDLCTTVGGSEHSGGITTALAVLRDVLNLTRRPGTRPRR